MVFKKMIYLQSVFTLCILIGFSSCSYPTDHTVTLYIGSVGKTDSSGISICKFDTITGELTHLRTVVALSNCNYLHVSNESNLLFSVAEGDNKSFKINSYKILPNDSLVFLSSVDALGKDPCFVEYIEDAKLLISSNYSSGNIVFFNVNDGIIEQGKQIAHYGDGPYKSRQEAPHAHSIRYDPENGYFYSADLGADKIMVYNLNDSNLVVCDSVMCKPGAGPRHLDFHPSKNFMAVVNELDCTVTIYKANDVNIYSTPIQTVSLLPDAYADFAKAADIHFSPDGNYLYASNRGFNTVAIFKVDNQGYLEFIEFQTEGINWPRNFNILSSGKWLLVANRDDNQVRVFKRDLESGLLNSVGSALDTELPVCIKERINGAK